jgi:sulfatase modifying factor 1
VRLSSFLEGFGLLALPALVACGSSQSATPAADASIGGSGDGSTGVRDAAFDAAPIADAGPAEAAAAPCPAGMVFIGTYCIDTWEAYVVELDDAGVEHPHSPFDVVDGLTVRAKTAGGVFPQGYISQVEATQACALAGKRLCSPDEFHQACEGPNWADGGTWYPYGGETRIPGYCNADKGSEMPLLFGDDSSDWTYADFNDPRLNQIDGGLAPTGSYPHCESPYGIFDCVGNLHEWGNDPADSEGHGRFRGGFYGDATLNGPGCLYVTSAHALTYHDYSTGFRCCADEP